MNSISSSADQATDAVKDAASHARENVLEIGAQLLRLLNRARDANVLSFDSWLHRVGLRRHGGIGQVVQPLVFFAAGAVVGAGAGLLFAPTSGSKLREDIAALVAEQIEKLGTMFKPAVSTAEQGMERGERGESAAKGVANRVESKMRSGDNGEKHARTS